MKQWFIKLFANKYLSQLQKFLDGNKTLAAVVLLLLTTLQHYYSDSTFAEILAVIIQAVSGATGDPQAIAGLALLVVGILDKVRKLYFGLRKVAVDNQQVKK